MQIKGSNWWWACDEEHMHQHEQSFPCCCLRGFEWSPAAKACVACQPGVSCGSKMAVAESLHWWSSCESQNMETCFMPLEHSGALNLFSCCVPGMAYNPATEACEPCGEGKPGSSACPNEVIPGSEHWWGFLSNVYLCAPPGSAPLRVMDGTVKAAIWAAIGAVLCCCCCGFLLFACCKHHGASSGESSDESSGE